MGKQNFTLMIVLFVWLSALAVAVDASDGTVLSSNNEPFGLISENAQSADKIPLILVHGDNSFRYDEDRWGTFLNWVSNNENFDNQYEIWRFHHNTEALIGYDGASGNAGELGDAILQKFGPDRPVLLLAHSRGGLVSRSYMNGYGDGNEGDRVLGLVTLATPHHGSPAASPDWGLLSVLGKKNETELASYIYGYSQDHVVNVSDMGTMGLVWDNFDGPENGIFYKSFSLSCNLGETHDLSILDANVKNPVLEEGQSDKTRYMPDRSFGTLEEMNGDLRYVGGIIAYGGYDTDLGAGGAAPFNWLNLSFTDHAGLEIATQLLADFPSRGITGEEERYFMANDGMVPLQSAFFLKKDTANEPMYTVEEDENWLSLESNKIHLKDFRDRMHFRKAVICPDFDHLHMVEGNMDKYDFWEHVAASLTSLANLSEADRRTFSPVLETFEDSLPEISEVIDSGCFINTIGFGGFGADR